MTLPRLITRRRVKWVGTVAVAGIAMLYMMSGWRAAGVGRTTTNGELWVFVDAGALCVTSGCGDLGLPVSEWYVDFHFGDHGRTTTVLWIDWESYANSSSVWRVAVFIPLWLPLLLIAAPTAWLWRIDRRAKPWQCANCRYDLRGIEGGVCPECGAGHGKVPG